MDSFIFLAFFLIEVMINYRFIKFILGYAQEYLLKLYGNCISVLF